MFLKMDKHKNIIPINFSKHGCCCAKKGPVNLLKILANIPTCINENVVRAFDNIADVYNDIISKPKTFFSDLLFRELRIPKNPMVLDVGCGTGKMIFELIKKVHGNGKFYGVDISQKMIDLARVRAEDLGYTNVEFIKGNAEQLFFPESSFDLVICYQAFPFFLNQRKALKEIFRVIKPRGQVALLFFGEPTFKEIKEIYNKVRIHHPELIMPESLQLINLEETYELFEKAGFKKTKIYGIHQIDYVDPSKFIYAVDAPTSFWRISLPLDFSSKLAEKIRREIKLEMTRAKKDKGFKITYYNIVVYAKKT